MIKKYRTTGLTNPVVRRDTIVRKKLKKNATHGEFPEPLPERGSAYPLSILGNRSGRTLLYTPPYGEFSHPFPLPLSTTIIAAVR